MYSLTYDNKLANNFLIVYIKIKMNDAFFETKMYGTPGSNDFPSTENLNKWIKNIEHDIMFFDIFNDEQGELTIGVKNNYFIINQLTIPIKYIKEDLINFLKKIKETNLKKTSILNK